MSGKKHKEKRELTKDSKDFMLKEYDRIHQLWLEENKQAEQRASFFLAVSTAVVGAIIILLQSTTLSQTHVFLASEAILLLLLLFGFSILNRLVIRNVQIKVFRASMEEIQRFFGENDDEIATYLSTMNKLYRGGKIMSRLHIVLLYLFSGSLTSLMILSNSLICSGIVMIALMFSGQSILIIAAFTLIVVFLSSFAFRKYCIRMGQVMPPWKYY